MSSSLGANPVTALTELLCAVRELLIPVILELVDHHCQHLSHRVIHTLHSTIAIWVVGADGNFPNPKKLVDRFRKL